jgi:hypothetical protein
MSVEALRDKRSNTHDDEINESIESVGDESDNHASSEDDDEFFDPEPAETDTFETDTAFDGSPDAKQKNRDIARMLMLQAAVMTPSHNRIGARCPVPDALPLKKSGDQVSSHRFISYYVLLHVIYILFYQHPRYHISYMLLTCNGPCP